MRGLARALGTAAMAVVVAASVPATAADGDDPVFGGWFGSWHERDVVTERLAQGDGALTDAAVFTWNFAGPGDPACTLAEDWSCRRGVTTPQLRAVKRAEVTAWASHVDITADYARQLALLLRDGPDRRRFVDLLVDRTVAAGVAGLDLDWENFAFNDGRQTWRRTRPAFVATVRRLGAALHAEGKLLSVTIPADPGFTVYAPGRIADHIDRLNLMAYDRSWESPGPIGPARWAHSSVRAAVAAVGPDNAHKVIVGAPLYGKSWATPGPGGVRTVGRCPVGWRPSDEPLRVSLTVAGALELAADHGKEPRFDRGSGEWTYTYSEPVAGEYRRTVGKGRSSRVVTRDRSCRISRTVWFGDARGVLRRTRMAAQEGIGGVFIWSLASSDETLFDRYRSQAKAVSAAPRREALAGPEIARRWVALIW